MGEVERIAALRSLEILDSLPEQAYDDLCSLASQICGTPISLISFVDETRSWFKSNGGLGATEMSRDIAFCAHTIYQRDVMIVRDATLDQRFSDNPLVKADPKIRFYAGMPLVTSDGFPVGALCVIDRIPRDLTGQQRDALRILRDQVVRLLELRRNEMEVKRAIAAQERVQRTLHETERRFFQFLDAVPAGVFVVDKDGNPHYANQAARKLLGKGIVSKAGPEELADTYQAYLAGTPQEYPASRMPIIRALSGETSMVSDMEIQRENKRIPVQVWGAPVYDDEGSVAYAIAAFSDISDRKRAEQRLSVLCAVTRVLAGSSTLRQAAPEVMRTLCEIMGWDVGALWEIDERDNLLDCVNLWHSPDTPIREFEALTKRLRLPSGMGLPGRVWAAGKPAWIKDVVEDPNFPRIPAALKNNLHGAFAFPILTGNEVMGIFEFFSKEIQEPDEELLSMLESLGAQVGQFLARRRAEQELALATSMGRDRNS